VVTQAILKISLVGQYEKKFKMHKFEVLEKHMPSPLEKDIQPPPLIVYTIPVSIEFFPNHNSCKVNSSLCTKKAKLYEYENSRKRQPNTTANWRQYIGKAI
jgi:hypothetical protein